MIKIILQSNRNLKVKIQSLDVNTINKNHAQSHEHNSFKVMFPDKEPLYSK